MADIIEFRNGTAPIVENGIDFDRIRQEGERTANFQKTLAECVDQALTKLICDIPGNPLEGLQFQIMPERITCLAPEDLAAGRIPDQIYFTKGEDPVYSLLVAVSANGEGQLSVSLREVCKWEHDSTLYRLSIGTGEWNTNPQLNRMIRLANGSTEFSRYLRALRQHANVFLEMLNEREISSMMQRDRTLVRLGSKLGGIAWYGFLGTGIHLERAVLIPNDPRRCGSAVGIEGSDYVLYQYLTSENMEATARMEGEGTVYDYKLGGFKPRCDEDGYYYLCEVARTQDEREMCDALWMLWDHVSPETTFSIPLSLRSYIVTKDPLRRFHIRTGTGEKKLGELDRSERTAYVGMRRVFNLKLFS